VRRVLVVAGFWWAVDEELEAHAVLSGGNRGVWKRIQEIKFKANTNI
jgi:hypothetical protein